VNSGNVTFDPLAFAVPARDAAIEEVINLDTGEIVETAGYIRGHRYGDLIHARLRVRSRLRNQSPEFACALCGTPAYIVSNQKKNFFFRHAAEDGSCPSLTRGELTEQEIRARKYHGLQESTAHKRIKGMIVRSLNADAAFADVSEEKSWRSISSPRQRRQPDVQARLGDLRIAFEIQLSTTFLDVVVGRREFYRGENAMLIWIMGHFDPNYRRLTTDDMLFSNNANILVADEQTAALSEASGVFHLRCIHRRPGRDSHGIIGAWEEHVVPIHQLTLDVEDQRAFFFDYHTAEVAVLSAIDAEKAAASEEAAQLLRIAFLEKWHHDGTLYKQRYEHDAVWHEMRERIEKHGVSLPAADLDGKLTTVINAILSCEAGYPIGWRFKNLVEVGHHLAEHHPDLLLFYGYANQEFERAAILVEQDKSQRWQKRSRTIFEALSLREAEYMPDPTLLSILDLLFPAIAKRVRDFNGTTT
tara:strand:- start:2083 stop:3501 length:1419 start_codon:yes stop_codon:yes gene_type:complete